jgi:hypothetical protein
MLDLALQASACDQATVPNKPRLLSDNGSNYISGEPPEIMNTPNQDIRLAQAN